MRKHTDSGALHGVKSNKKPWLLVILLFCFFSADIASALTLNVWTDRPHYKTGDTMVVRVSLSHRGSVSPVDLYIVAQIGNQLYYYPSFSKSAEGAAITMAPPDGFSGTGTVGSFDIDYCPGATLLWHIACTERGSMKLIAQSCCQVTFSELEPTPSFTPGLAQSPTENPVIATISPTPPDMEKVEGTVQTGFGMYEAPKVPFSPSIPDYTVNTDLSNVLRLNDYAISNQGCAALASRHFFAQSSNRRSILDIYQENMEEGTPSFVTADILLHSTGSILDYVRRNLEYNSFADELRLLSTGAYDFLLKMRNSVKTEPIRGELNRDLAYFCVAAELLGADFAIDAEIRTSVEEELALIDAYDQHTDSPIFGVLIDYSQFEPKGHYADKSVMRDFFKARTWFEGVPFALTGADEKTLQTNLLRSIWIVQALLKGKADGVSPLVRWDRIFRPMVFFRGLENDVTPIDLRSILEDVAGHDWSNQPPEYFCDRKLQNRILAEAEKLPDPEMGRAVKSFRLFGRGYLLDSYIFKRVTYDYVGAPDAPRSLPRALDIFSVMRSGRSEDILLNEYEADLYSGYIEAIEELRREPAQWGPEEWVAGMHSCWFFSLLPLLTEHGGGYPIFMQQPAWVDKDLNAGLGSWVELRCDAEFSVKPAVASAGFGDTPNPFQIIPVGYVEPQPEVYARSAAMLRYMLGGISARGLDVSMFKQNIEEMIGILNRAAGISISELQNEPLSREDRSFIHTIGESLRDALTFPSCDGGPTTEVADRILCVTDVFPDYKNGELLEEALGCPHELFVIAPADEGLILTRGALFSYYEFPQPLKDPLTNETWKRVYAEDAQIANPVWQNSFLIQP